MFVNSNSPLRILLEVASLNVSRAAELALSEEILVAIELDNILHQVWTYQQF